MVDYSAMAGLASSLKAMSDLVQSAIGLRDAGVLHSKIIELQGSIMAAQAAALSAQQQQFSMGERIRALEQENTNLEAWGDQKERYELIELTDGVFAYSLKQQAREGEPAHVICANCYGDRTRSIVQEEVRNPGRVHVKYCPHCGLEHFIHGGSEPNHQTSKRRPN